MSFTLMPHSKAPAKGASLDDIFATATTRRGMSPSFRCLAAILRGQDEEYDSLHALAQLVASGTGGLIETASLAGSFNPVVARQLSVGKIR